ncbi:hypothetical protein AB6D11_18755 [Vibrio splendidus]
MFPKTLRQRVESLFTRHFRECTCAWEGETLLASFPVGNQEVMCQVRYQPLQRITRIGWRMGKAKQTNFTTLSSISPVSELKGVIDAMFMAWGRDIESATGSGVGILRTLANLNPLRVDLGLILPDPIGAVWQQAITPPMVASLEQYAQQNPTSFVMWMKEFDSPFKQAFSINLKSSPKRLLDACSPTNEWVNALIPLEQPNPNATKLSDLPMLSALVDTHGHAGAQEALLTMLNQLRANGHVG